MVLTAADVILITFLVILISFTVGVFIYILYLYLENKDQPQLKKITWFELIWIIWIELFEL